MIITEEKGTDKFTVTLNKGTNLATGQDAKDLAFTEQIWGKATCGYLVSIKKMTSDALYIVVDQAREIALKKYYGCSDAAVEEDEELERAALVEFGAECKFRLFNCDIVLTEFDRVERSARLHRDGKKLPGELFLCWRNVVLFFVVS